MVNVPNTNDRAFVKITSLAHNQTIRFFPYDFEFDDSFKPEWGNYDAFGRMDPIMIYKRTTRDVNLSFNVVAEDQQSAADNFTSLQTLIKCLYPSYKDVDISTTAQALEEKRNKLLEEQQRAEQQNATTPPETSSPDDVTNQAQSRDVAQITAEIQQSDAMITQQYQLVSDFGIKVMQKSPLFQISFMNLLTNQEFVAAVTNFKHKMKFDAADTSYSPSGIAIPGEFNISLSFKVLHNNLPGTFLNYNI